MKAIITKNAPQAVGAYSQGQLAGNTLYVSGQIPFVPETITLISQNIKEQTQQCLDNILGIVKEAGMTKENIVRCTVYMTNLTDFPLMNEVYGAFFGDHKPSRAAVGVVALPKNVQIEIDAIAVKE
ncbi:MAG: Rid family detoxifying hydrolase [Bacilli bacterium]